MIVEYSTTNQSCPTGKTGLLLSGHTFIANYFPNPGLAINSIDGQSWIGNGLDSGHPREVCVNETPKHEEKNGECKD